MICCVSVGSYECVDRKEVLVQLIYKSVSSVWNSRSPGKVTMAEVHHQTPQSLSLSQIKMQIWFVILGTHAWISIFVTVFRHFANVCRNIPFCPRKSWYPYSRAHHMSGQWRWNHICSRPLQHSLMEPDTYYNTTQPWENLVLMWVGTFSN